MIKNNVYYFNKMEIEKEIKILLKDENTTNIFINGSHINAFKDIILKIHNDLGIERVLVSECTLISQFSDYMSELFNFSQLQYVTQFNLIITNAEQAIKNINNHTKSPINKIILIKIFDDLCKYFENEIVAVDSNGSRRSFDVYLCEDDFDIEVYKSKLINLLNMK